MRLIKMLGLAALAVVAAMACVGATSASATGSSALCKVHEEGCAPENLVTSIHAIASNSLLQITVLGVTVGMVCESSLAEGTVLELGQPQVIHLTKLTWVSCKRESNSATCTVTTNEKEGSLGLIDILLAALNLGTAEVLNVSATVSCTGLPTCTYGGNPALTLEGALHQAGTGHGMLTANKTSMSVEGGGLCPATALWTVLFEPLQHLYGGS